MNLDSVTEHIHHLMDQVKHIKGVKVNYHEKFVSLLEAALTRGDDSLCQYVEALYKKGCYLDAWGEYFDKNIWFETAEELGINLSQRAEHQYSLDEELPWDFIDTGINKEWFKAEYTKAMMIDANSPHIVPTCQQRCVGCGVCPNLGIKKMLVTCDETNKASEQTIISNGGIFEKSIEVEGTIIKRYWIDLTKVGEEG